MSFNSILVGRPAQTAGPHMLIPTQTETDNNVPELSAGVVAGADVYSQPTGNSKLSISLQSPATWTYIVVAVAFIYLIGIYVGAIRIAGRGGE